MRRFSFPSPTPGKNDNNALPFLAAFLIGLFGNQAISAAPVAQVTAGNRVIIENNQTTTSRLDQTDFGTVQLGEKSAKVIIEMWNLGDSAMSFGTTSTVYLTGPHAGDFGLTSTPNNNQTVNPGNRKFFQVQFSPTDVGLRTATLHIMVNDPLLDGGYSFDVAGIGTTATLTAFQAGIDSMPITKGKKKTKNFVDSFEYSGTAYISVSGGDYIPANSNGTLRLYNDTNNDNFINPKTDALMVPPILLTKKIKVDKIGKVKIKFVLPSQPTGINLFGFLDFSGPVLDSNLTNNSGLAPLPQLP